MQRFYNLRDKKIIDIIFCILSAFAVLAICTRSSFLYCYNNWDDANSYFSVGKAIMNGLVPYRDVFDQKGMCLYFFYGLAYLVSHKTFAGVFILEIVMATLFAMAMVRILKLYLSDLVAYIIMPFVLFSIYSSTSFWWGGSAEEMMLPFTAWGLYLFLRWCRIDTPMGNRDIFIAGILAGVVANIKFNSLGFFFAWMMLVFLREVSMRKIKEAFLHCLVFLGGMFTVFIPWIIFFALHGALYSWYEGYIYMNVFIYSDLGEKALTLYDRIYAMAKILYYLYFLNPQYMFLLTFGLLAFLFKRKHSIFERISPIVLIGFLFLGIYIGGVELRYYSLPLSAFVVFGYIFVGLFVEGVLNAIASRMKENKILDFLPIVSVLLAVALCFHFSMNTYFMKEDKDTYFLTVFKDMIEESGVENPTLLNVNMLDGGLYTVTGIVPNCRWFQTQTLPIETPVAEQTRYMREGLVDFVMAIGYPAERIGDGYDLICEYYEDTPGEEYTYYLYQKKPSE